MALKSSNPLEQKRKELKELDDAIAERKQYHNAQKKLVNDMVEAGNTQLMGLTHDIAVAKQELRDLKTDIRAASRDKVMLDGDLQAIRRDLEQAASGTMVFA